MMFFYAFLASLIYVFLRATQQLHVVNDQRARVLPTSLAMGACEVFVMVNVVKTADSFGGLCFLALCMGLGGGIGCITAMFIRNRGRS